MWPRPPLRQVQHTHGTARCALRQVAPEVSRCQWPHSALPRLMRRQITCNGLSARNGGCVLGPDAQPVASTIWKIYRLTKEAELLFGTCFSSKLGPRPHPINASQWVGSVIPPPRGGSRGSCGRFHAALANQCARTPRPLASPVPRSYSPAAQAPATAHLKPKAALFWHLVRICTARQAKRFSQLAKPSRRVSLPSRRRCHPDKNPSLARFSVRVRFAR